MDGERSRRRVVVWAALLATALWARAGAEPLIEPATLPQPTKNFVTNGDFEVYRRKAVPGWRENARTLREGRAQLQEEAKHSGNYALRLVASQMLPGRIGQTLPLNVGETYTLSAWIKCENMGSLKGGGSAGVKLVDRGWRWSVSLTPAAATSDWQQYSVTFKTPPVHEIFEKEEQIFVVLVYVPVDDTGVLWVDDIQVELGDRATTFMPKSIPSLRSSTAHLNEAHARSGVVATALEKLTPRTSACDELAGRVDALMGRIQDASRQLHAFETTGDRKWAALVKSAEQLHRQARQLSLHVWWTNPWERYDRRQAPADAKPPEAGALRLAVNDYAPLALMLTNLTDQAMDVRVRLLAPESGPFRDHMRMRGPSWATLRQAHMVAPSDKRDSEYPTVLAPLDGSQTIMVGAADTTQLWIDVDTAGMEPGVYEATLELVPQQDVEAQSIPVTLNVVPVTLPERCPAEVFCWGGLESFFNFSELSKLPQEQIDALWDPWLLDMKRHGVNRMICGSTWFTPQFADDDTLAEPIDFSRHDKFMASLRRYFDKFVGGYSVAVYHMPREPGAKFERRFAAMMKAWTDHLAQSGITPKDILFQPFDEPEGKRLEFFETACAVLERTAPEWDVLTTVSKYTLEALKAQAKMLDVMVLDYKDVRRFMSPEAHEAVREGGRDIWVYRCAPLMQMEPYGYLRVTHWQAWAWGYKGYGFYYSTRYMYSPRDNVYSPFYFGTDGPVPSRGWQAFWRGTRDWTYLAELRDRAKAAREDGRQKDADEAEAVLKEAVAEVTGAPDNAALADQWRERILDQLVKLAARVPAD